MSRWNMLASEKLITTVWLEVERNTYRTTDGQIVTDYYVVRRRPFVLVVAEHADQVVLVRQFRPATDRFYLSLPAGYVNQGESPESAASREFSEETGVKCHDIVKLAELHPLPGYVDSPAHVFTCRIDEGVSWSPEDGDVSDVVTLPWDTVLKAILTGEINEMQAVAALLLVWQQRHAAGRSMPRG